ncbi:exodeoxyribonuclease III [Gammaproteobacteria bacterium]|nr:exodeoxyribonuclease III [Gammaproteobacteria bacterium]MDB9959501.1 exodeoxyribonuclease III [Gammaproteobacteria bacterium]MDB9985001.1 exodeoxyribonuclease III [Gammaproteobacteria bacterium]
MRIVSFNINSIRARPHQLIHLRDTLDPDVIGLQETKVNDPDFPLEVIEEIGYHPEYWGQKGHYGVAFLSKKKPIKTIKGFKKDTAEDQKRFIECTFSTGKSEITIMNGYFPQGENINHESKFPKKIKYYDDLELHIKKLKKTKENLIIMGDFNVAPEDIDIGIGPDNMKRWLRDGKTSFQPQEREMWNSIKDIGFVDSWRVKHPEESSIYSWFDYRSKMFDDDPKRGLRIDHIMVSNNLKDSIKDVGIDYDSRGMEKPSDHCPVWVDLDI